MKKNLKNKGFTLIELLVVIAIIAILAAIVLVAINPAKRFQDARNTQRKANVEAILAAVQQNMVDNKGILTGCPSLPTSAGNAATIAAPAGSGEVNLAPCLDDYLAVLPVDPQTGTWTSPTSYDTDYTIWQDSTTKQVTINAPSSSADGGGTISISR